MSDSVLDNLLEQYQQNNNLIPPLLMERLHDTLAQLSMSIAEIDGEIIHALDSVSEAKIASLTESRECLWLRKGPLQRLVAPIRRLPTELVAEIMERTVPTQWEHRTEAGSTRKNFGRLRSICKSWRAIAHSVPALWRSPWVEKTVYSSHVLQNFCDIFEAWYGPAPRARCAVDLNIVHTVHEVRNGHPAKGTAQQLLSYISTSHIQWKTITLGRMTWGVDSTSYITLLQGLLQPSSPWETVDKLAFDLCSVSAPIVLSTLDMSLETAFPKLESLAILPWPRWTTSIEYGLNFRHSNIRNLLLDGLTNSPRKITSLLKGLPLLEELVLSLSYNQGARDTQEDGDSDLGGGVAVTIPSLKRMELCSDRSLSVLGALVCPALTYLAFCGDFGIGSFARSKIVPFISMRNGGRLTLSLRGAYSPEPRDFANVICHMVHDLPIHRLLITSLEDLCAVTLDRITGTRRSKFLRTVEQVVCSQVQRRGSWNISKTLKKSLERAETRSIKVRDTTLEVLVATGGTSDSDFEGVPELLLLANFDVKWLDKEDIENIRDAHQVQTLVGHW